MHSLFFTPASLENARPFPFQSVDLEVRGNWTLSLADFSFDPHFEGYWIDQRHLSPVFELFTESGLVLGCPRPARSKVGLVDVKVSRPFPRGALFSTRLASIIACLGGP